MWSWLLKLMQFFRDEEEEVHEKREQQAGSRPVYSANQLQAKTKNIYPRERERDSTYTPRRIREKERHFRFPVIPDTPREKRSTPDEKRRERTAAATDFAYIPLTNESEKQTSPASPQKRAYTPTEVVSPVFGRLKPERERERRSEHAKQPKNTEASRNELNELPELSRKLPEPNWSKLLQALDRAGTQKTAERLERDKSAEPQQAVRMMEEAQSDPRDERENELEAAAASLGNTPNMGARLSEEESEEIAEGLTADTAGEVVEADGAVGAVEADTEASEQVSPSCDIAPRFEQDMIGVETEAVGIEQEAVGIEQEAVGIEQEAVGTKQEALGIEQEAIEVNQTVPGVAQDALTGPQVSPEPPLLQERTASSASSIHNAIKSDESNEPTYLYPDVSLLTPSPPAALVDDEYTQIQRMLLEDTLSNFNVSAQVIGIVKGPSVTRFELQPAPGVKVNKITSLIDDIKLNLAAKDIRIEAPIPGRNAVGIEVPNLKSEAIFIRRIIESEKFRNHPSPLAIALGMDIGGEPIVSDIKKMPHGLIAGSTGSGKSVCINSIIISLLYKASPEQVRLLLIDPKMVELAPYNNLPHLVTPVVTDAKQATAALKWAVEEMERRYTLFADAGARDIERYNLTTDETLPYIVIIIDELADLMMVSPQDVEECIIRIAQKARACGIHLLLATQRPSVDVITGNIKANVPTRLAFAVFSQVDSRTILDQSGAERLLGRGDMLFLESGATPIRLQGNYVSDDEIERVTQMIKKHRKPAYLFSKEDLEQSVQSYDMGDDPLYLEALVHVAEQGQASASALQRRFRIGYNRAARLIDMMEAEGHISGQSGGKGRTVLITKEDAQALADGSTLV